MSTTDQRTEATHALGQTWEEITAQCLADVQRFGMLTEDQVAAMGSPQRPLAPYVQVGGLVAIYAHQRYRAARVYKVGRKNVSALYLAPAHLDNHARLGIALDPINITGVPVAVLKG